MVRRNPPTAPRAGSRTALGGSADGSDCRLLAVERRFGAIVIPDDVNDRLAERGVTLNTRYRSEREDWIQSMVLAGMGCAIVPEFIPLFPRLPTRLVTDPEVTREVGLATIAGRQFSPAVKAKRRREEGDEGGCSLRSSALV